MNIIETSFALTNEERQISFNDPYINFAINPKGLVAKQELVESLWYLSGYVKRITEEKREGGKKFLHDLLCNLNRAIIHDRVLSIGVRTVGDHYGINTKMVRQLIAAAIGDGFIELYRPGYYIKDDSWQKCKAKMNQSSRYKPSIKSLEVMDVAACTFEHDPDVVGVKRADGTVETATPTYGEVVLRQHEEVKEFNKMIAGRANIPIAPYVIKKLRSAESFLGGRIYSAHQNMPKSTRKHIKLDGVPVAEVDLKNNHLRMALYLLGGQIPEDQDLYMGLYDLPRKEAKMAVLAWLNAENPKAFFCDKRRGAPFRWDGWQYDLFEEELLAKYPCLERIKGIGFGNVLQFIEGYVLSAVQQHMLSEFNIPSLNMFDGLLIPEHVEGQDDVVGGVRTFMEDATIQAIDIRFRPIIPELISQCIRWQEEKKAARASNRLAAKAAKAVKEVADAVVSTVKDVFTPTSPALTTA